LHRILSRISRWMSPALCLSKIRDCRSEFGLSSAATRSRRPAGRNSGIPEERPALHVRVICCHRRRLRLIQISVKSRDLVCWYRGQEPTRTARLTTHKLLRSGRAHASRSVQPCKPVRHATELPTPARCEASARAPILPRQRSVQERFLRSEVAAPGACVLPPPPAAPSSHVAAQKLAPAEDCPRSRTRSAAQTPQPQAQSPVSAALPTHR